MNKPLDPVSARQARQGKPILAILAASLALAFIGGWLLWGMMADNGSTTQIETNAPQSLETPVAPDS